MDKLPTKLPMDILRLLERRGGPGVDAAAVREAAQEIARRYGVTQVEGLRAVHNVLGGVAANARLHELPPEAAWSVERAAAHRQYLIELYPAPAGSTFRDEYRLREIDTLSGKRENTLHWSWEEATAQAQWQFGIDPHEWTQAPQE